MKYLVYYERRYYVMDAENVKALLETITSIAGLAIWRLRETAEPLRLSIRGTRNALYLTDQYGNMEVI